MKQTDAVRQLRFRSRALNAGIVAVAFAAALVIKSFFVDAVVISSTSMEGTLQAGDFVLVNKWEVGRWSIEY